MAWDIEVADECAVVRMNTSKVNVQNEPRSRTGTGDTSVYSATSRASPTSIPRALAI